MDEELDKKTQLLKESEQKLNAISEYLSSLIESKEKKKGTEYVKIHETEKNNFSLLATDRRCKILEELIKNKNSVILKYRSSYSGVETNFNLLLELEYNKQSASNKVITNNQINQLYL